MNEDEPELDAVDESDDPDDSSAAYALAAEWFLQDVPNHYADTINVSIGPYGTSVTFGIRNRRGPTPSVRVHMSHQMAIVLERLMRRILTTYEIEHGVRLYMDPSVLAELRLTDEDMQQIQDELEEAIE